MNNKVYPETMIIAFLFILTHACQVEVSLHHRLISHTMQRRAAAAVPFISSRIFPGCMTKRFRNECSPTLPTPCDKMAYRPHLRIQSVSAQSAITLKLLFLGVIMFEFCV